LAHSLQMVLVFTMGTETLPVGLRTAIIKLIRMDQVMVLPGPAATARNV
jgi:hypothetical protein